MPGAGARWDGFYVGGQVGMSYPGIDFANDHVAARRSCCADDDRERDHGRPTGPLLGKADTSVQQLSAGSSATNSNGTARWSASKRNYNSHNNSSVGDRHRSRALWRPPTAFLNSVRSTAPRRPHHRLRHAARARRLGGRQLHALRDFRRCARPAGHHADGDAERHGASTPTGFVPTLRSDRRAEAKTGEFAYGYAAGVGIDMC